MLKELHIQQNVVINITFATKEFIIKIIFVTFFLYFKMSITLQNLIVHYCYINLNIRQI